jgi:serine/threonine protein kinase
MVAARPHRGGSSLSVPHRDRGAANKDLTPLVGGRYRLLGRVGAGGMATVYRARDERSDRDVAVKVIRERLGGDGALVRRFRREAELGARLAHPNIVAVLDAGRDFMVMELVRGADAGMLVRRRGRLPCAEVVHLVAQVAAALQHAHDQGLVHGDVSPGNILVGDGGTTAKLADFGLACGVRERPRACGAEVMGTPGYVAPEVAGGDGPSPSSDVYSLGAVAYRLAGGRASARPADRDATAPLPTAVTPMPVLADACPDLPRAVAEAVQRAVDRDPGARQASAEGFGAELLAGLRPELALAA